MRLYQFDHFSLLFAEGVSLQSPRSAMIGNSLVFGMAIAKRCRKYTNSEEIWNENKGLCSGVRYWCTKLAKILISITDMNR